MTTKPVNLQSVARQLPPLPDPPKKDMQQHINFVLPGIAGTVALHLGAMLPGSTTLVSGDGYLCRSRSDLPGCPYPDMVVAFDVNWEDVIFTNGYVH